MLTLAIIGVLAVVLGGVAAHMRRRRTFPGPYD